MLMAQCPACKFHASTNFLQPNATCTMSKRLRCVPTVLKMEGQSPHPVCPLAPGRRHLFIRRQLAQHLGQAAMRFST